MSPHFRGRLVAAAALAAPLIAAPAALTLTLPATPAAAVTCPSGSTTFNSENDASGVQTFQTADNYGTNANTCISTSASGAWKVTQANASPANSFPTSFPSDQYGCSSVSCTFGWTSQLWSTPAEHLSVTFSNTGVNTGDKYDYLLDQFMTTSTGAFSPPSAEVEIVIKANPSYSNLGFCVSTTCDPTGPHTINGVTGTWWEQKKTATGCSGTCSWPDYLFVRSTSQASVTNFCMKCFRTAADAEGSGGNLGSLKLGYEAPGTELWPAAGSTDGGINLQITTSGMTSEP